MPDCFRGISPKVGPALARSSAATPGWSRPERKSPNHPSPRFLQPESGAKIKFTSIRSQLDMALICHAERSREPARARRKGPCASLRYNQTPSVMPTPSTLSFREAQRRGILLSTGAGNQQIPHFVRNDKMVGSTIAGGKPAPHLFQNRLTLLNHNMRGIFSGDGAHLPEAEL